MTTNQDQPDIAAPARGASTDESQATSGDVEPSASLLEEDGAADTALERKDVYSRPVVDGRVVSDHLPARVGALTRDLLTSQREREEGELEYALRERTALTRTNVVAVASPKGGVGKTTCTYLVGTLLSSHAHLRVLAMDANPDWGTLAKLAPDGCCSPYSLAHVIAKMDRITSAAELYPYLSTTPSGLQLLAAPSHPEVMETMRPDLYGRLIAYLSRLYDVILLDLGTGLTRPLARFALERADQAVIVTTPEWTTSSTVLDALHYVQQRLGGGHLSVVLNQAPPKETGDVQALEAQFRKHQIRRQVTVPYNQRLRTMLDSGTYNTGALERETRLAVKRLALAVTQQLV